MQVKTRRCQSCKKNFDIQSEDFLFYEKIQVPPPTWCYECRMIRRIAFRNERSLYRRTCDMCKNDIVAMYSSDSSYVIYCKECWFSDNWDPLEYGREYDFSRPFFEQVKELMVVVPRMARVDFGININSDFSNFIKGDKDTFLAFSAVDCENVLYTYAADRLKDCVDNLFLKDSSLCYENIDAGSNNRCSYMVQARDCMESSFLYDCVNCKNCFMSSNLRNSQYVFYKEQLTKEEYEKRMSEVRTGDYKAALHLRAEYKDMISKSLHKYAHIIKADNSSGENISESRNARHVFNGYNCENVKYLARVFNVKDSYDIYGSADGELLYEASTAGFENTRVRFFTFGSGLQDSWYTDLSQNSAYLFGCVGVRKKQYCILNKQYTIEEYEELLPKIKEHMNAMPYVDGGGRKYGFGEFFPTELSTFAYNETIAQELYPLTKEDALEKGFVWREEDARDLSISKKSSELSDSINEVDDTITQEVIACEHEAACNQQCTTAFRILSSELEFYRTMKLPLPRLCPNCRYYERLQYRAPMRLYKRQCMCDYAVYENVDQHAHHRDGRCTNEFETSYLPERKEIIYCEQCYNAEVV